jgi:hypothetical protein
VSVGTAPYSSYSNSVYSNKLWEETENITMLTSIASEIMGLRT